MNWTSVIDAISRAEQIVLFPHVYADGDALGSCAAFACFLMEKGKQVTVITEEIIDRKLSFIAEISGVDFRMGETFPVSDNALAIAVDVSDGDRLASRRSLFERFPTRVRIDHHAVSNPFAPLTVCNPDWAATAEGIYELLSEMGCRWDVETAQEERTADVLKRIAVCIYTALVTDTGCFAYSNVTAVTFRIAAQMREITGDLSWIYRRVFENKTKSSIALTAIAYAKTVYHAAGQIAFLQLSGEDYQKAKASDGDSEGFSAMLRAIEGVHVSAFVRDGRSPGEMRISLRSDEQCDVALCAAEFGGGGHARAAGITYRPSGEESFEAFIGRLLAQLSAQLSKSSARKV